jgi:hypothetical protein
LGQETQDARDGAQANVDFSKESQRKPHHIDLGPAGHGLWLALELIQARLGFFEGLLGLVALSCDSRQLLAQVTILVTALFGFALPLISTVFDLSKLTQGARSSRPMASGHGRRLGLQSNAAHRIERSVA